MASVPERLMGILEELVGEQLKAFQWFLYSDVLEGLPHIPRARFDGADRVDVANLLVQTYGYDDAVVVTVDILTRMKLKLLAETLQKYNKGPSFQVNKESDEHVIQEKLKSTLREKYQNHYDGNADEGETIYLKKIYTELYVIEGAVGSFSEDHEIGHLRSVPLTTGESTIKLSNLFKPHPNQNKWIRTVLTQGIPGVGKTVCAQKYTLSWAEGEDNQDITYIFPLPFRELNPNISEKDYSLMQLLHQFFPLMKPLKMFGTESKILFIFDGLDESRLPLNFKQNKVLRDETEPASLDVLITNLITGDLLGNALVWITSRPTAANRIPRKYLHQWTEVRGFTNEQKVEYFKKRLHDDKLAGRIINHVKSSRILHIMCQIPIFCWITATVMKKMLCDNMTGDMPNTLTEMYVYLLLCHTGRMKDGDYPVESDNFVLKLAELAFRQLEKGSLVFYEADLKECSIDVEKATIYSGMCTKEGRMGQEVFSFVHLTVQEFLAAVYAHHCYMQRKENVLLGYLKRISTRYLPKSMFNFHKTAIDKALESGNGHWDLFLRFLLGLSLKSNQMLLCRVLDLEIEGEEDVAKIIQFIKEKIKEEPESKLNLFHCLSELKEESLVQEIQSFIRYGRLSAKQLSPAQWSALTYELMTSSATEEEFDLKKYTRSEEGLIKLLTVISSSSRALLNRCNLTENCCQLLTSAISSPSSQLTALDLSENNLKDLGVKLLSVGLESPHCKLKSLRLCKCKLEGDCCDTLAVALSSKSTRLKELDLSANNIHEAGFKALCEGMCSPHCKLETVWLKQCKLKENCCGVLASVLSSGSSQLKNLDLSNNNLKDSGASLLFEGLTSSQCQLETLRLHLCGLTQKSCNRIGAALSCDPSHLRELDLSGNNLQGRGLQLLCVGFKDPHCKLEILRLNECKLQQCCADLTSVLTLSTSHLKQLDLSENDLHDLDVKMLADGLAAPDCKLESLRLSFCGVTVQGCVHLASALKSNPSHLRKLDLSYNYLQDSGVKLMTDHRADPSCKLEELRVDHNAECYLKSTLKNNALYASHRCLQANVGHEHSRQLSVSARRGKPGDMGEGETAVPGSPRSV
ncbi:NACHT, LRR and PYD domains-containing protein 12-like isoform X2 [Thalassophryne amazonica]|uniref:NACHT, LRR and PYD domains-containing protein 12-like isoform X2 n=1 Tax=Thalassophryne amazonica TaxID=390379 RepID=UPI0014716DED|nr:NACHT, LRR and PYD domains-containing protein 12-like isoform X2 [Thalassophryne amazonica]